MDICTRPYPNVSPVRLGLGSLKVMPFVLRGGFLYVVPGYYWVLRVLGTIPYNCS